MPDHTDATGLMAFWADITPDHVFDFQRWHNCEHVPERVSIPGFRRGRRYRHDSNDPAFLMMYETASPGTLSSKPYLDALNAPSDWTRRALTYFSNPARNIYGLQAATGTEDGFVAPFVAAVRFNQPLASDAVPWLSVLSDAPGILRAQLWRVDAEIGGIETAERKIYGGGPGEQEYLALIESETGRAAADAALATADGVAPDMALREDQILDHYWLEICHPAPTGNEA